MGKILLSKNKLSVKVLILTLVLLLQGALAYGESLGAEGEKDLEDAMKGTQDDITYIYKNGELKLDWGQKNTGGYEISIKDFSMDNNKLIVDYTLTSPGDAPVIQVITHPSDTKTIPSEMRDFDQIELNLLEHKKLDDEKRLDEEEKLYEDEKEEKSKLLTLILRLIRMLPFNF